MPLEPKLLEILVCPITKQSLRILSNKQLALLNQAIIDGKVSHSNGDLIDQPVIEGLVTQNSQTIYLIEDGIPVMLEDHSIATTQIENW